MVPNSGQWSHCQRSMIAKWVMRTVCTSFSPSRRLRFIDLCSSASSLPPSPSSFPSTLGCSFLLPPFSEVLDSPIPMGINTAGENVQSCNTIHLIFFVLFYNTSFLNPAYLRSRRWRAFFVIIYSFVLSRQGLCSKPSRSISPQSWSSTSSSFSLSSW